MSGTISFNLVPSPPNPIIAPRVEGAVAGYGTFIATNVTLQPISPGSTTSSAVGFATSAVLPATTKFYNPMSVSWSLGGNGSPCGSNCTTVGTTAGRVYVTLGSPTLSPVAETYVHLAASISGAATPAQAFQNTWSLFAGPANVTTWDGSPLFYYKPGQGFNACATTPGDLLTSGTGSGQCGSFALLFEAALAMNGIPVQLTTSSNPAAKASFVAIGTSDNSLMVVRNWVFSTTPTYGSATYAWSMMLNNGDFMVPPLASYGDLTNSAGLAGQGTPTPSEKVFGSHFIVKVDSSLLPQGFMGGPYFDPSYGVSYASAADFEDKAIAGYAIQDPNRISSNTTIAGTWFWVVKQPSAPLIIQFSK